MPAVKPKLRQTRPGGETVSGENSGGDTSEETVYGREIAYELENLETSPADFVQKYAPSSESGGTYVYNLEKNFTLTVKPGDTWEDTEIFLKSPKGYNYRLCYDFYRVHTEYARVENTSYDYNYTSYSSDSSHFVRTDAKYYDPETYGWGGWIKTHFIDGVTEALTFYGKDGNNSDGAVWVPSGTRFAYTSYKNIRKTTEASKVPVIVIADAADGSYITIPAEFEGYTTIMADILEWSPDGRCLLAKVALREADSSSEVYFYVVYDTENEESVFFEEAEDWNALPYCGIYNALYEYPFDWSRVTG